MLKKIAAYSLLFSLQSFAQNLSPDEQKKLLEEVQALKQKVEAMESQQGSTKMLETLKKGQAYQESQQKALDELDKAE